VEDLRSIEEFEVPGVNTARLLKALGLTLAFALVVAAAWLMLPRKGQLGIDVVDSKGRSLDRVEIFVDGRKRCDTAPCALDGLRAGGHGVRATADGYETPPSETVTVQGGMRASATITARSRGGIRVAGVHAGVKLFVDEKEVGPLPQVIDDLGPGDHLTGKINGEAEKTYTVAMRPNPGLVATQSAEPSAPPDVAARQTSASEPVSATEKGFVNINSIPASSCFLDGNSLGSTPKIRVAVTPGTHVVKFVNAEEDLEKTISITVGPCETKPAVAKLE
jgi:hypothetical protein